MTAPRFERDRPPRGPSVRSYSALGFEVDGTTYPAVLLTPERALRWEPPASVAELSERHFDAVLGATPAFEFLILGTGSAIAFPPRELVEAFDSAGIGIEAMDSRAAARTWGVLRAEERWIAAAIMPL